LLHEIGSLPHPIPPSIAMAISRSNLDGELRSWGDRIAQYCSTFAHLIVAQNQSSQDDPSRALRRNVVEAFQLPSLLSLGVLQTTINLLLQYALSTVCTSTFDKHYSQVRYTAQLTGKSTSKRDVQTQFVGHCTGQ
jgi:hypothetical protein